MIVKDEIIVIAIEGLTFLLMTRRIFAHTERVCTRFGEQVQTSSGAGKIEKAFQKAMDTQKLLYPRKKTSFAGIWYNSELLGKSGRKETEERLDQKLNFSHGCLAAAGEVRVVSGGSKWGQVPPSQWR